MTRCTSFLLPFLTSTCPGLYCTETPCWRPSTFRSKSNDWEPIFPGRSSADPREHPAPQRNHLCFPRGTMFHSLGNTYTRQPLEAPRSSTRRGSSIISLHSLEWFSPKKPLHKATPYSLPSCSLKGQSWILNATFPLESAISSESTSGREKRRPFHMACDIWPLFTTGYLSFN